jgi:hypothetical protein
VRRTARVALAASIVWGLGVWYLGEGLYGIASGHASLAMGAPGAGLLLAILACAAWPAPGRDGSRELPAPWLPFAWAITWVGGAAFQAVPGQVGVHGALLVPLLVAAEYLVGVGALVRITRLPAAALGLALALALWVTTQDFGAVASGQATDPNSGPVLALMGVAVMSLAPMPLRFARTSRAARSRARHAPVGRPARA